MKVVFPTLFFFFEGVFVSFFLFHSSKGEEKKLVFFPSHLTCRVLAQKQHRRLRVEVGIGQAGREEGAELVGLLDGLDCFCFYF